MPFLFTKKEKKKKGLVFFCLVSTYYALHSMQYMLMITVYIRAVARSENPGGLVVLGGENVPPLVEIGLSNLPKTGGGSPVYYILEQ